MASCCADGDEDAARVTQFVGVSFRVGTGVVTGCGVYDPGGWPCGPGIFELPPGLMPEYV